MSDIPVISITQECSDDEVDEMSKLDINEALTDTEDLFMDQDTVRYRKSPAKSSPTGNSMIDAIVPTASGSVTDVEDCTDSEDGAEPKSAREADISLDCFLDQGNVDETTKSSNKGSKPKILTRSFSKTTDSDSLQVFADTSNALTDCEDCALSDDDDSLGKVSIPDCPDDILTKDVETDAVDIHNSMKRKQEKHTHHKQDAVDGSSSDSDNDCKVRHRRVHRRTQEERPRSEYENLLLSDDDMAGACAAKPPPERQSALFDAEELVLEGSDIEDDRTQNFPEINITFVSEMPDDPPESSAAKPKRPSSLGVQAPNPDEALTDVENLDSSDSEDEKQTTGMRLIPRAVVRQGRTGGTTDVEDFDDSDDNDQGTPDPKTEVGREFLPSPVREMAILRQGNSGEQRQNVMPLNQGLLMVQTPDIEQALTDVEDMSDTEETGEMYDSSKYAIESMPDMENGDVYSSDSTCVKAAKLGVTSPTQEPKTDTEDLFFERSASNSGSGSELRRRRKPKQSHGHSTTNASSCQQQFKGKKFLPETKEDTAATATTDVEDMDLSDDANDCGFAPSKQRRATIQVSGLSGASNECGAKTDVEFLSGDECVNDHRSVHSPQLCFDGYSSRERNGPGSATMLEVYTIPLIRKLSPTPDTRNCDTDCEDLQDASDGDDPVEGIYSRAQTATPFELTRALDESAGCEIHESSARSKGVLLDVKGTAASDHQEMHTDVEFLDDDAGNGADQ